MAGADRSSGKLIMTSFSVSVSSQKNSAPAGGCSESRAAYRASRAVCAEPPPLGRFGARDRIPAGTSRFYPQSVGREPKRRLVRPKAAGILRPFWGRAVHKLPIAGNPSEVQAGWRWRACKHGFGVTMKYVASSTVLRSQAHDAGEVATVWDGLISGHWSLVGRFDRDGKRHLLLRRNRAAERAAVTLTPHEASVVDYAVLGHSNKRMAYELAISQSNVSECLRRACAKLGVGTRAGLMELVSTKMATYAGAETRVALSFALPRPESATPAVLTASEQSVFRALLAGQSNSAIAASRGRASRTIANQVAAIFRKLHVSSRAELLASRAIRQSVHSFSVTPFPEGVALHIERAKQRPRRRLDPEATAAAAPFAIAARVGATATRAG